MHFHFHISLVARVVLVQALYLVFMSLHLSYNNLNFSLNDPGFKKSILSRDTTYTFVKCLVW